nr:helix-turn-helix domain-containing protein [uncultured Methanoregula sp.]
MYPPQLPPSSKTVLEILDAGGAMTHKDLVQKSHLAPRTVRYALKKLKERQLIIEKFNFRDARQIIYQNRAEHTNKLQPACV